jgi:hypothetical protein
MAQTTLGGDFTDLWSAPQIYNEHSRHSFEIYICPFNFPPQGFNSYRDLARLFTVITVKRKDLSVLRANIVKSHGSRPHGRQLAVAVWTMS